MAVRQATTSTLRTMRRYNTLSAGSVSVAATGGTTSDVSNYNGTGQTWRVHSFTSNSTFTVTQSGTSERNPGVASPQITGASYLIVGGGFNGNTATGNCCTPSFRSGGAGGQGGTYILSTSATIPGGANSVTIGAGNGGNTVLGSFTTASGGTSGGAAGASGGYGSSGGNGSVGLTSTITGSSVQYSGGGGGGGSATNSHPNSVGGGTGAAGAGNGAGASTDCCAPGGYGAGGSGAANRGAGGGGGSVTSQQYACCGAGGAGGTGIAIVAYRIA